MLQKLTFIRKLVHNSGKRENSEEKTLFWGNFWLKEKKLLKKSFWVKNIFFGGKSVFETVRTNLGENIFG